MDVKELNKKQLILLTLLITFVVSIATGIITVSIMQQMPKSVPQTINNVIQRTIEKVTTTAAPAQTPTTTTTETKEPASIVGDGDAMVPVYLATDIKVTTSDTPSDQPVEQPKALGQGVIISDVGLILVDSSILNDKDSYKVLLNKTYFDADILKKFSNGFTIMKITIKKDDATKVDTPPTDGGTPKVDTKQ